MKSKKVGVTGGIGAGKSIVSKIFNALGIPVYNADLMAKKLMTTNLDLVERIKQYFGDNAYLIDGAVNRGHLAQYVFNDPEQLKTLNSLVHPVVKRDFDEWTLKQNTTYVLKEAALIYETGSYQLLDKTICVTAPENMRIKRVLNRDEFRKEEEVYRIMENQWKEADKIKLADFIIKNDDNEMILPQILKIHQTLNN